jgi:phospholipid/cholesterol/gamma-HCH transport system permease protein
MPRAPLRSPTLNSPAAPPPTDDDAPPRIERAAADGPVVARGRWTSLGFSSRRDWEALASSLEGTSVEQAWDLRGITQLDHIGGQLLWNHWRQGWPARIELGASHKAVLEHVAQFTTSAPPQTGPDWFERLRSALNRGPVLLRIGRDALRLVGQLVLDIGTLIRAPHRAPWRDFSGHLYQIGATALPITALVGVLIGVVLAYLTSNQLRNYGAETFIVNILGLSLIRELGPVLAAVLVAGRSGSAITAQIGVMRVNEELDAMRVMGIPHGFRLVMPRVLALAIAMPLISIWTSMAAMAGGMFAADLALGISPSYFMQSLPRAVPFVNIVLAMSKSAVFGVLIALIACYFGLKVKPNTESLGRGTTSSVVTSITVVILVDALFAVLFRGVGFR